MKITLVDDEQLIVEGLKKIISRRFLEAEIRAFTDPAKALETLEKSPGDLLITDIRMPGMTGLQLIQKAKEAGARYCAVLTGLNDVPLLQESIRLQVCDYLIKPVNKEELFALILRVQEQAVQDRAEQANELADRFCSGAWEDVHVANELSSRMRRSDCPPFVLEDFIRAIGRDLPFWDVCRQAVPVVKGQTGDAEFGAWIRQLPVLKNVSSADIQNILAEFGKNFAQDLTVTRMGAEMHLQPNYLTTLFKKETGKGFVQYLNQYRIEAACRMILTEPGLPMQEVAEACGFPSLRYFFTVFKKMTGNAPGAFRDQMGAAGFIRS